MDHSDKKKFYDILTLMAEDKGEGLSKARLKMLWDELSRYPLDQVETACSNMMRIRKYARFPSLSEFIEYIEGRKDDAADLDALAVIASIEAVKCLDDNKPSTDRFIALTLEHLGGFPVSHERIAAMGYERVDWWRKEFISVWKSLVREHKRKELTDGGSYSLPKETQKAVGPLCGLSEQPEKVDRKEDGRLGRETGGEILPDTEY